MEKTLVAFSATLVTLSGQPVYADDTQDCAVPAEVSVTVRFDNSAGVPEHTLRSAKARTEEIFRRIGVTLSWFDPRDAVRNQTRPSYTLVLLTPEGERRKAASDGVAKDVVGQAVTAARRAYVFHQRVIAMVSLPDRDIVTLLGYAMAHELGHLMLPPHSHSQTGIMRPKYATDHRAIPSFTEVEATAIRRRLADDAAGTLAREHAAARSDIHRSSAGETAVRGE